MKMLNSLALGLMFSLLCFSTLAQTRPGSLRGSVTDSITHEPIPRVNVVLKNAAGELVDGRTSDKEGKYNINPIAPGHYNVEVSFIGYRTLLIKEVLISPNAPTVLTFEMNASSTHLEPIEILGDLPMAGKPYSHKAIDPVKWSPEAADKALK